MIPKFNIGDVIGLINPLGIATNKVNGKIVDIKYWTGPYSNGYYSYYVFWAYLPFQGTRQAIVKPARQSAAYLELNYQKID